jgi:hypothetical protein
MVTGSAEADERISVPYLASASQNEYTRNGDKGAEQDSAATAYTTSNARSPLAHVVRTTKETALIFQSKSFLQACNSCRSRKSKCDERQPMCGTCARLKLSCVYGQARKPKFVIPS